MKYRNQATKIFVTSLLSLFLAQPVAHAFEQKALVPPALAKKVMELGNTATKESGWWLIQLLPILQAQQVIDADAKHCLDIVLADTQDRLELRSELRMHIKEYNELVTADTIDRKELRATISDITVFVEHNSLICEKQSLYGQTKKFIKKYKKPLLAGAALIASGTCLRYALNYWNTLAPTGTKKAFCFEGIPFINQCDGEEEIKKKDYHTTKTCGVACIQMMLNKLKPGTEYDYLNLCKRLRIKLDDQETSTYPDTFRTWPYVEDMTTVLHEEGLSYRLNFAPPEQFTKADDKFTMLKNGLEDGPIAVLIKNESPYPVGHWTLLVGYNEKEFLFLDPARQLEKHGHYSQAFDYASFGKIWTTLACQALDKKVPANLD